ncbi:protein kinase C theta type-like [Hyperolius riggenbachi]|uniref:protein kinase C theta type-like n=1 Tax=Hyperolius riggenbachi TaxID=752182 RepID=UPI0035A2CA6C
MSYTEEISRRQRGAYPNGSSPQLINHNSPYDIGPSGIQTIRTPLTVDSFKIHHRLGEGAFGKVHLASHLASDQQLAIKMVKKKDPELIFRECQVLETLRKGPFITQLFGTFQSEDYLYIAMEYMSGGELLELMERLKVADERFDITTLRLFAAQMIIGLEYIHSKGIIHRDIKPNNILLDGVGNIKIADFGLAAQNVFQHDTIKGSREWAVYYMAPEVCLEMDYGHTIDYFSMGVVLCEMACNKHPFMVDCYDEESAVRRSICNDLPDFSEVMDLTLEDFLEKLLCKKQKDRKELVKNLRKEPFLSRINWKAVESGEAQPPFQNYHRKNQARP